MRIYSVSSNVESDDSPGAALRTPPWHERAPRDIVGASWILFGTSLCLPALELSNGSPSWGISLLLLGWLGVIAGSVAWFANPLLLIANHSLRQHHVRLALSVSLLASAVALSTPTLSTVMVDGAGNTASVIGYGFGFYLWLGSCLVTCLGSLTLWVHALREKPHVTQSEPSRPSAPSHHPSDRAA